MTQALQQPGTLPDTKNGINMTINLSQPFPVALQAGVDESTQQAVLGFVVDDFFVFNPRLSTCGRFEVDPEQAYGLAPEAADQLIALNKLIDEATQAAINESCRVIQEALGISSGDSAGHHFSEDDHTLQFSRGVAAYLCHELKMSRLHEQSVPPAPTNRS